MVSSRVAIYYEKTTLNSDSLSFIDLRYTLSMSLISKRNMILAFAQIKSAITIFKILLMSIDFYKNYLMDWFSKY